MLELGKIVSVKTGHVSKDTVAPWLGKQRTRRRRGGGLEPPAALSLPTSVGCPPLKGCSLPSLSWFLRLSDLTAD